MGNSQIKDSPVHCPASLEQSKENDLTIRNCENCDQQSNTKIEITATMADENVDATNTDMACAGGGGGDAAVTSFTVNERGNCSFEVLMSPGRAGGDVIIHSPLRVTKAAASLTPKSVTDIEERLKRAEERRQSMEKSRIEKSACEDKLKAAAMRRSVLEEEYKSAAEEKISKIEVVVENKEQILKERVEKLQEEDRKIEQAQRRLENARVEERQKAEVVLSEAVERREQILQDIREKQLAHDQHVAEVVAKAKENLTPQNSVDSNMDVNT